MDSQKEKKGIVESVKNWFQKTWEFFTSPKMKGAYSIIATIVLLVYIFVAKPIVSFGFIGLPVVILTLSAFIFIWWRWKRRVIFWGLVILPVSITLGLPHLFSIPMLFSDNYVSIIGNINRSDFVKDMGELKEGKTPKIDVLEAQRLSEKRLGDDPTLDSVAQLGYTNCQWVDGEEVCITPVEFSGGLLKWWKNRDLNLGYMEVSRYTGKARYVNTFDGTKEVNLKYQEGAFLWYNLSRHLYLHGYIFEGIEKPHLELRDGDRKPFLISPIYKKVMGIINEVVGVILTDPMTGENEFYRAGEEPEWVDSIHPNSFLHEQLKLALRYKEGWRNQLETGANKNITKPTDGNNSVGMQRGMWMYTHASGMDGQNSVGFYMINKKTKEVRFYRESGATEKDMMASAQGMVQDMGYLPSYPVPAVLKGNVIGIIPLKDKQGLQKGFSVSSINNHTKIVYAEDSERALSNYLSEFGSSEGKFQFAGKVFRISHIGSGKYQLMLEGTSKMFLLGTNIDSKEVPLTRQGDWVLVRFDRPEDAIISVSHFENENLTFSEGSKFSFELTEPEAVPVTEEVQVEARPVVEQTDVAPWIPYLLLPLTKTFNKRAPWGGALFCVLYYFPNFVFSRNL